jgi:hypothetical protein
MPGGGEWVATGGMRSDRCSPAEPPVVRSPPVSAGPTEASTRGRVDAGRVGASGPVSGPVPHPRSRTWVAAAEKRLSGSSLSEAAAKSGAVRSLNPTAQPVGVSFRGTRATPPPAESGPVIEIAHLSKRYRGRPAVDDASSSGAAGWVTALAGPNGAAKSSVLRMLLRLDRPGAATAVIGGRRYRELDPPGAGDDVVVLRDGRTVADGPITTITAGNGSLEDAFLALTMAGLLPHDAMVDALAREADGLLVMAAGAGVPIGGGGPSLRHRDG